ncbi:MAG TPA: AI-2E family transporter [Gemmatimonadaceae bacterium]|nr:AI-2E family transporter [Gemmatimonadaceae bacterium]
MTETVKTAPLSPPAAWRSRDVLRVAALVIGVYAAAQLLWATRALIFTTFLGVLFGIAVAAGTDRLQQFRLPRWLGAPLIVVAFLGLLGAFGTWIGPTVRDQSIELRTRLPEAIDKLENWIENRGGGVISTVLGIEGEGDQDPLLQPAPRDTIGLTGIDDAPVPGTIPDDVEPRLTLRERVLEQLGGATRYFLPVLSSTVAVFAGILLVIFLSIYVAINPGTYRRGLMFMVPARSRERAGIIIHAVTVMMRRWLVTQLIAMVVIGAVTTVVLLFLQVRAAVPLGILAGLLEFVPTIGPILSAIPAIAMGFVDSPEKALYVTIAYILIQFVENQVLIPILMNEGIDLPPALTIVAQALMAIAFGFLGLVVAVPLLAAILVSIKTAHALNTADEAASAAAAPPGGAGTPADAPAAG